MPARLKTPTKFAINILLLPTISYTCPLQTLAKGILAQHCSQVVEKQQQLLAQLKETHDADLNNALLRDTLIDALEKNDTFPVLTNNKQTVDTAIRLFSNTPGFLPILRHILVTVDAPNDAKGSLYLLERAIDFAPHGEIQALSTEKQVLLPIEMTKIEQAKKSPPEAEQENPLIRGVVDIVTARVWVKCKNINWNKLPLHVKNLARVTELKEQFLTLQQLADEYNATHTEDDVTFVVSSKTAIPASWKAWFDDHIIAYWQQN